MHKFASLVISGSMVSSVIMQLCNHASSLDSADVINETHWLQVRRFRNPVSISLITLCPPELGLTEDPSPSHPLCFSFVGGIRSLRHLVPSRLPCRVTSTSIYLLFNSYAHDRRSLPIAS